MEQYRRLSVLGRLPESYALSGIDWPLGYGTDQEPLRQRGEKDSGRMCELGPGCRGTLMRSRMEELGTERAGWLGLSRPQGPRAPQREGPYNRRTGQHPMLRPQASRAESYLNLVGKGAKFELGCLKRTKGAVGRAQS